MVRDTIIATATAVSCAATIIYTYVTCRLLRANKEATDLSRKAVELNREVFLATHRPMLGIEVQMFVATSLEPSVTSAPISQVQQAYTVKNHGHDKAANVVFELVYPRTAYTEQINVGDLQPGESRKIGGAVQRMIAQHAMLWLQELRSSRHLKFEVRFDYSWQAAPERIFGELVNVCITPDEQMQKAITAAAQAL